MTLEVREYRKRPLLTEAVQLTFDNAPEVARWCEGVLECHYQTAGVARVIVHTKEGSHRAQAWRENPRSGPWIVKGPEGEFGTCAASIFERVYELVAAEKPVEKPVEKPAEKKVARAS